MISGEGAEEKPYSAVASPCDRESDGGDDMSHYSSCGAESEFERYCSASSAMGTPSFRSNSFQDCDVWSLKSLKLGGENSIAKNFGGERVLLGYGESDHLSASGRGDEFPLDGKDNEISSLNGRVESFVVRDAGLLENFDSEGDWERKVEIGDRTDVDGVEISGSSNGKKGIDLREDLEINGGEDGDLFDESEASSRSEHSEGEDSMFGCGSDDERKTGFYFAKNVAVPGGETQRNENPLVMNSAVAFGSDDWDDFAQENSLDSIVWDKNQERRQTSMQSGTEPTHFTATKSVSYSGGLSLKGQQNEVRSTPSSCNQVEIGAKLDRRNMDALSMSSTSNVAKLDGRFEEVKRVAAAPSNEVSDVDELAKYLGCNSDYNLFQRSKDSVTIDATRYGELKIGRSESDMRHQEKTNHADVLRNRDSGEINIESDPLSESEVSCHDAAAAEDVEIREARLTKDESSFALPSLSIATSSATAKNFAFAFDKIEDHFVPDKTKDFVLTDFCDEIVNDMEDILLDSGESTGPRFVHGNRIHQSHSHKASRDGGSSASTSGTEHAYSFMQQPHRIDRIEVVGARQKKGNVSFSERLVGVQYYTSYVIRVWSGEDHWEVERRYRDFSALYFRLKKIFADCGWTLPLPWSSVERESLKLFGNASPGVVADRSVLIQECLQSLIHPKFLSSSLNALTDFLTPSEGVLNSPASDGSASQSPISNRVTQKEEFSTLGKTISLVVHIHPPKSMKQMLDMQHYRCAGCHKNFDDGRTKVQGFVQALGWGKPRLCKYSGQLFCSSCHNNDYAVLPARVLHYWDFTQYPVSQLAKFFLDSIIDKPMLCVSAVNPFLFSKVPTLQHVANLRNRIRAMIPYVRCPFRRSVYKGLGSRKYLLDSNDFFALRDLIDLSKGVFSALPAMVESVSRKIQEHITEQCLVCYDTGIPCSARKDCDNPLALIFPFQEGEVEKCRSCKSVFHKNCFKKIMSCSCGTYFKQEKVKQKAEEGTRIMNANLNLPEQTAESSSGLLSSLFSKVMPGIRKLESKGSDNVILMGSFPNNSL